MNIFVANLSFKLENEELEALFAQHGAVSSAKIITDRDTGRSKGYGFVEMDDDAEGDQAIEALNGMLIQGRNIVVKKARPRESAGAGGGGGGGRRSYDSNRY